MNMSSPRASRSKNPTFGKYSRRRLYMAIIAASQMAVSSMVEAGPTGGNVVGGAGNIDRNELSTTIRQDSDRLAINWESFNLDANESVTFIQPDASAIALNRILGNSGSEIHGRIDANGQVVLVNPHGVFFGKNATVNVGGLIASGLDIDSEITRQPR